MTIRTRLLVLVLSVMVPAFLAAAIAVWFVFTEQRLAQEKGISEAARTLALLIDKEIETSENLLFGLAASPALERNDLRTFYEHARRLGQPQESTIVLTDLDGRQILNTRLPFGAEAPPPNSDMMALRRQAGQEATIVSNLFYAPVGKHYDFAIQVPVTIEGQLRYYLARGMAANLMQAVLKGHALPDNWIASVIDRKGIVVARTLDGERFVGQSVSGSLAEKIGQGHVSGTNKGYTLDGRHVQAFFHKAPSSQWVVIFSVPVSELQQPAIRAALLLTALMGLILASALLLARHYAFKTLVSVQRLHENATRLGRGEAALPAPSGITELDSVHAALVSADNRIRQASADLEQRVAQAVESTERAQRALLHAQKLEALGRLTGGIAHDFNNVLQTLTTSLQLIRIERNAERMQQRIGMCEKAIARATALVGQMRAFGRVNDAKRETLDLAQAVAGVMPMWQSALPSNIRFVLDLDAPLWPVTVDPVQFELSILNLLINARDAMPAGGEVRVCVRNLAAAAPAPGMAAGDYVHIRVIDSGTGMAAEVLQNALDPFFTTKPVDKGTGLGLPQAYGFATQSGGMLTLDSQPGAGTTVHLYLPRAEAPPTALTSSAGGDASSSRLAGGTLLFVDDDELVRDSVVPTLAEAGFRVMIAKDGDEAWSLLESGVHVDALFSDIVMPGQMNGITLARLVRSRYPAVVVLLATGYTNETIDVPGVRLMNKPYKTAEVIDVLSAALPACQTSQ